MRHYSFVDQLLCFLSGHQIAADNLRPNPAKNIAESDLSEAERKHSAGLMRINYAGEVCAQALYQGQALTAKNVEIKTKLEKAGLEEIDHLYWCQSRINDLNSHVSFLNPVWYAGSFLLGTFAGLCGDKWNLGFLEETEKQVAAHLKNHLEEIPQDDNKTRVILEKMYEEENHHAEIAHDAGAAELPAPLKIAMKYMSKLMTKTAYWI